MLAVCSPDLLCSAEVKGDQLPGQTRACPGLLPATVPSRHCDSRSHVPGLVSPALCALGKEVQLANHCLWLMPLLQFWLHFGGNCL